MRFSVLVAVALVNFAAAAYVPRSSHGSQPINAACRGDADCASGCCGFNSGKCAGVVTALERDGGCGFGETKPNDKGGRTFLR